MSKIGPFLDLSTVNRDIKAMPQYVVAHNVLTKKECSGAIKWATTHGDRTTGKIGSGNIEKGIRDTELFWFKHNALKEKIENVIYRINKENWNLKLTECEFFQMGIYNKGGHYSWHPDGSSNIGTTKHRKLSFTLILNPSSSWEGGKFQIFESLTREGKPMIKTVDKINRVGSIVVFPSTLLHRVTPVTSGQRISLVGWVWGPNTA